MNIEGFDFGHTKNELIKLLKVLNLDCEEENGKE